MSLPVAHGFLGATVVAALLPRVSIQRHWQILLLGAFLAISPDLDYFFYVVLGLGESWHRTFTHSIFFAIATGVLIGAFLKTNRARMGIIYALATVSHPILDALTSKHNGGVELFWPLYTERIRFGIVNYPLIVQTSQSWSDTFFDFIVTCMVEFAFFAPIFIAVLFLRKAMRLQVE